MAKVLTVQSSRTLGHPMSCSLPGFSVHGILQARTLELSTHSFLQESFPIQGLNPGLLHCMQILHHLSHQGSKPQCLWKGHAKQHQSRQLDIYTHLSQLWGLSKGRASSNLGSVRESYSRTRSTSKVTQQIGCPSLPTLCPADLKYIKAWYFRRC